MVATMLGGVAWVGSGRVLERRALQEVSDRWREVEVCVLGDAGHDTRRASERVRLARLAVVHGPEGRSWPARCLDHARAFDDAAMSRAARERLGDLPSAAKIVADVDRRLGELDQLVERVTGADLPLPRRAATAPPAPAAPPAQFEGRALDVLGSVETLEQIDAAFDPGNRRALRLLLPEAKGVSVCDLDADWRRASCRPVPVEVPEGAKVRLAPAPDGAVDLVHVRDAGESDGFYDGSTGLPVHRTRFFDAQAFVEPSGRTTVFTARLDGEKVEGFRLLRLLPGQRPSTHKLKIPTDTRPVLLRDALLWWPSDGPERVAVHAQPLDGGHDRVVATVPQGSRPVAHCRDGDDVAILVAAGLQERRYTVLMGRGDRYVARGVGVIHGPVTMSCHGDAAHLHRRRDRSLTRWRCRADGCLPDQLTGLPAADGVFAVGSVGDGFAMVWSAAESDALRLRVGDQATVTEARDHLLLDEGRREPMRAIDLRWIDAGDLSLLLVQDEGLRVRVLRVDGTGQVEAVHVER